MKHQFLSILLVLLTLTANAPKTYANIGAIVPVDSKVEQEDNVELDTKVDAIVDPTAGMSDIELKTHDLVNKYRQFKNLPPLTLDPAISAQARIHSEEMARSGNMNHDGFKSRAAGIAETIVYRSVAENVAFNEGFGQPDLVAVKGWIESPGHQRNMVGKYDLTGISVVKNAKGEYYFTQLFVKKAWYVKDAD